jgi:hypothetical protein
MPIKEKKLQEFLERLAQRSGASELSQEVAGLFKKEAKPKEDTPVVKADVPKEKDGSDAT